MSALHSGERLDMDYIGIQIQISPEFHVKGLKLSNMGKIRGGQDTLNKQIL